MKLIRGISVSGAGASATAGGGGGSHGGSLWEGLCQQDCESPEHHPFSQTPQCWPWSCRGTWGGRRGASPVSRSRGSTWQNGGVQSLESAGGCCCRGGGSAPPSAPAPGSLPLPLALTLPGFPSTGTHLLSGCTESLGGHGMLAGCGCSSGAMKLPGAHSPVRVPAALCCVGPFSVSAPRSAKMTF